jgi:hypothetical protein
MDTDLRGHFRIEFFSKGIEFRKKSALDPDHPNVFSTGSLRLDSGWSGLGRISKRRGYSY